MRVDLFDFDLPQDRIALAPISPRDAAHMLVVKPGQSPADHHVRDLSALLRPGDLLVSNDTKVIPARLFGRRGDAKVEITLHKQEGPAVWRAFAKNAKRLRAGDLIHFADDFTAMVEDKFDGGEVRLALRAEGLSVMDALLRDGVMPLPPYIASKRQVDQDDSRDYQTMFAAREGAVAAPTAGLHFTEDLLENLKAAGIGHELVTLHVGAGTFLPVKAEDTDDHRMHAEWGEVTAATADRLNAARAQGGRIVAVGTTSLRVLESAASPKGKIGAFQGDTDIFITPGYQFRAVDILMTNFHLPKSTLFMLVSAFSGLETMQTAYRHAIERQYRFYSYGDACLLFR